MNTRQKVLEDALKCVNGEREKQYGNPEDNFSRIADLWSVYLTSLFEDEKVVVDIDPIDVAKMMILFKIARSNGDKDKLDNYVDMIGYGACAAEIFENENPTGKVFIDEWVGSMKGSEALNNDSLNQCPKCEKLASGWLDCEHCKYEPMDSHEYPCSECDPDKNGGTLFESDARQKIELADECKSCDYAKKCIGTGVCLKEEEEKCLLDQKDPYSYAHDKLHNYVLVKAKEEYIPLKKLNDIISKFTDYLDQAATDCVANGKQFLDCYKEIDEMFEKYKSNDKDECDNAVAEAISAYVPNGAIKIHKFVDDNRLNMDFDFEKSPKGRDRFNDVARAFIGGIGNSNVKITTFEAPKDWYLHDVFMNETGQIIVRFKEDEK